jgi:NADH-quinone oxidoreductase subunit N
MIAQVSTPSVDWFALSPSLILLGVGSICLLAAVLVPADWRRLFAALTAAAGFVGAFVAAALLFDKSPTAQDVVAGAVVRDRFGAFAALLVCGAGLLTVGVAYSRQARQEHAAEFYALLGAGAAGMIFVAQSNNLMTLFLGLEWFSISLYILCAIELGLVGSLEAGLKYLIVGGFGSAFLLFGSALVYGATGELQFAEIARATSAQGLSDDVLLLIGLAMLLVGLGYKASAAPFHMWTPDVYQGAPTPVSGFMSAATKTVALMLAMRVLVTAFPAEDDLWTAAVAAMACASLAIGNLAALVQRDLKRLLAYSSISHAGFMLIAIAADNDLGGRALLYYLIPYSAMSIGAFAVVAARERELGGRAVTIDSVAGMGWERPLYGIAMWAFMLGFAGLPPTGGFVGKFYVFSAAYERGWSWLIVVGVVATAVSLYYYLAVLRAMYMRSPLEAGVVAAGGRPPREWALNATVAACVAVAVGSFFAVQPLIDLAREAISSSLQF